MFAGSSMDLDLADKKANAILQTWYPGGQGGKALAKVLFGEVSPCGKLPITLYSTENTLPEFTDYSMKGRTYTIVRPP
jgi:beta-glucosidase